MSTRFFSTDTASAAVPTPPRAEAGRRNRLLGLEAGRFVAALLVACFHYTAAFDHLRHVDVLGLAFRAGHAGVEYFFVLSGFIIYHIHRPDIGRPAALHGFAWKRFIRLYPMYWATFAVVALGMLAQHAFFSHRDTSAGGIVLDALLLPMKGDAVIGQSWSLRHEIIFYLLFALAIRNGRAGLTALVTWQAASLVVGLIWPDSLPQAIKPFLYLYNIGFGFGIAAAWFCGRHRLPWPGLFAFIGLIGFFGAMVVEWRLGGELSDSKLPLGDRLSPLLYLSFSTLIIVGVTQLEASRPLPVAGLLKLLGGSSYLLYLIHAAVGSTVIRILARPIFAAIPDGVQFLIMVLAAIGLAIVGHLLIEKPLLAFLRKRILTPREMPSVAPD